MLSDPDKAPPAPDAAAIRADLEYMTARWREIDQPLRFEIRAFKEGAQPQTSNWAQDEISDAAAWAARMNELKYNVYVVRNPIRDECRGSAKDEDIVAAFFMWADCDDADAADNVRRFEGPKYSAAVTTGRTPTTRVHIYWQLEKACTDLAQWRDTQSRIASFFKSDASVINPSRIMRLGGTVAFPDSRKRKRGYISEAATLRTEYPDPREPVAFDRFARVFPAVQASPAPDAPFDIDADPAQGKEVRDYLDILRRARTDGEKHTGVRDMAASLAGQGVSRAMCEALVRDACPVWDRNVEDLIASAYEKFYNAPPEPVEATPQAVTDFKIDNSADFLADLQPLEYLIDGLLPTGVVYSLTGHAGHGKTTLALQFALSVATGSDFHARETSKGSVLILAGENPYNVKWQYAAALAARDLRPSDVDIHFVQGRFSIAEWTEVLRAKMEAMPNLKLVIVDSLQAFFEGDNDNDNSQMVQMAHKLRAVSDVPARPAMLIIAHPAGKTPSKDNLVPRGGGAFLNEIDGNLTVWSSDASQQTLHHSQKFRGAGFDPLEWVMQIHEFDHLTDINGVPLRLPVSRPELTLERANREQKSEDLLHDLICAIDANGKITHRGFSQISRIGASRAQRLFEKAKSENLIKREANKWVLTTGGKKFFDEK